MTQRSIVFMEPNEKPNADGSRELRHGLWKARPQWPARLVGLIVDGRDYNEGPAARLDGPRLQSIEVGNACELHAPEHLRRDGVTVGLSLSFVAQALRDAPPPVQPGEDVRIALLERVELVGLVLERIAIEPIREAAASEIREDLRRSWCAADLPAETVREARAVSRELALDSALRGLLEVADRYQGRASVLDAALRVAKATRAGVADERRQEGWNA